MQFVFPMGGFVPGESVPQIDMSRPRQGIGETWYYDPIQREFVLETEYRRRMEQRRSQTPSFRPRTN